MSSPSPSPDLSMAEAMGFTSFGAQAHPSKKRRFNPRTDAVVTAPARPPRAYGSAANAEPLGPPRARPSNLPLHPRDDDTSTYPLSFTDSDTLPLAQPMLPALVPNPASDLDTQPHSDPGLETQPGADSDSDPEPQYLDTSRPVGAGPEVDPEEEEMFQARIDTVVAAGNEAYGLAAGQQVGVERGVSSRGGGGEEGRGGRSGGGRGGRGGQHFQRGGGRGGSGSGSGGGREFNKEWYLGYYDPSSNENPWAKVESRMGIEARGTWLERGVK